MADFSLTTFSSKGTLKQIENALKAVENGETAIGIKCKTGVVLAVKKKFESILVEEDSIRKIQSIDSHVGATYAGLGGDYRILLQKARKHNMKYLLNYNEPILLTNLCRNVAQTVQEYTQSGGVRPFGISLLVAGVDNGCPQLYQIDPSGAYYEWKATAIGHNSQAVKAQLEKSYKEDMDVEDGIHIALLALKDSFEGEMTQKNVEIGVIEVGGDFVIRTQSQIADSIDSLNN